MCYGMGCRFEDYNGDCTKPRFTPCAIEEPEREEEERAAALAAEEEDEEED